MSTKRKPFNDIVLDPGIAGATVQKIDPSETDERYSKKGPNERFIFGDISLYWTRLETYSQK